MISIVASCAKSIESLRRMNEAFQPNTWADCYRMCSRCEVFAKLIMELKNFPNMLEETDDHEQELIVELEKTLIAAEAYVADFATRHSYKGMTEPSFRQGCSMDFAKLSQKLTKLAQDLSIINDVDYDLMRQEDLEDHKTSFKYAFLKILEEISESDQLEMEMHFANLRKDIESYPQSIGKFLALNKHMGLTVNETKALKLDIEWMKEKLEDAYKGNKSSNYTSPAQSNESREMNMAQNEKDLQMNTELVVRLMQGESLNNDQYSRKMKMLAELRLPQEDVVISKVRIGQGGFGDVYLGTFRRRYKVAIKTIRNMDDPYAENKKKSIENELLLMKFLGSYPTILSCYGYIMKESSLQIVLELAPYGSLDHMLRDKTNFRGFPLSLMVAWLCDLADAIKFLHSREIKHRDIKAENMLVFERFRIKLCDFGPAKQHLANVTAESKVGTFCFMAPEIRVGHVSEFASDIFSFAMTAIQILSRKTPKIDDFKGQVVQTVMQLAIPSPEINQKLHGLLSACVQYDPEVHPNMLRPTAEVVSRELMEILDGVGGDPREDSSDIMRDLESIARRKEAERLKPAGSPRSSIFRPQSGNMSRKNSPLLAMALSNDHLQVQQLHHIQQHHDSMESITTYSTGTHNQSLYEKNGMIPAGDLGSNIGSNIGSFTSQDYEDKMILAKFFQTKAACSQGDSFLVADMLVKNGVANLDILRRRLLRNEDFLLDLGVEDNLADSIFGEVVKKQSGKLESSSSFSSKGSGRFRRNALSPVTDVIPTEISRLYYDAAQCNRTEALDKLLEIVDRGDKLAECFIMRMYALGQGGIKKDIERAQEMGERLLPWLKDAIDSGSEMYLMYVRYLMGVCYAEGLGTHQDMREAVRWCRQSAEQGYAAAQAYLGFCYFSGIGVPRNLEEAVRWYRLSADQGYAGAQCNLGLCYEHGYGLARNSEEAVKWYRLSADQGDAAALFNLGYCYEKGIGVIEDAHDAVRFYKLSAGYGYTAAQYNLGVCFYFGTGVEQNMEEAVTWYRIAADKGYAPAQCNLGLCYENGHGIEKDYVEAVYWYRQSADQGHPAALYYLGFCYFSGMGVSKDVDEAVRFYKQSAEKKYPPAQNNLGFCYFNGLGVPKNYTIAVKWYRLAAEQGYAPAQYNMGYCYEKGYGVVTKLHAVIRWYRMAAENGNEKAKKALQRFQA